MGHHHESKKKSHKRRHDDDDDDTPHKHKHKRSKRKHSSKDAEPEDEDEWVEKKIELPPTVADDIPTRASLKLASHASEMPSAPTTTETRKAHREDWMLEPQALTEGYGEEPTDRRTMSGGVDFFSTLGTEYRKKKDNEIPPPDPNAVSSKELNPDLRNPSTPNQPSTSGDAARASPSKPTPGGPGSSWRMMRLRKVYETAEEENLPIEKVAIDRFGSLEAFEEAKEERRILDEREGKKSTPAAPRTYDRGAASASTGGEKGFMFTDSGMGSRSGSFRRPGGGGQSSASRPSTPMTGGSSNKHISSMRHTPIPSVLTPTTGVPSTGKEKRGLSPSSLNRLQAKVLRAKLMGAPNAAELEQEYEMEERRALGNHSPQHVSDEEEADRQGRVRTKVQMLPTLDGQGRLYDVGVGTPSDVASLETNARKRKKAEQNFETRDAKTGEVIRYNKDDDDMTLGEMLRQEKMKGGMKDQKDLDAEYARAIMGDGKYQNDLDYIDENAEKLGRKKMRSDAMKRQFAIHDYKRTQQALSNCPFCFGEDDSPPKAPMVSMGTRAYLSCTLTEPLVDGHCLIVPVQHHLCMLEADDDTWDEVKNYMKCLMRMFADRHDKGVVFYETVISHRMQRHTVIECVPLPWDVFEEMPGYFKESILTSESEWSQHQKLISFTPQRPFRRSMVANLPYFMVQFDYKGEKGFGHVIEGGSSTTQAEDEWGLGGEMGGGGKDFPRWFAGEVVGNVVGVEPRVWRNPRKLAAFGGGERLKQFRDGYSKYDWTELIGK